MAKIIIDKDIPYIRGVFEQFTSVEYLKGDEISPKDIENTLVLIVRTRTKCNAKLLENSGVKLIVTATIGTDHIDQEWCEMSGICVRSAQGCNSRGVLQWVSASLVLMCEKLGWKPADKTIGVVGVGHVGSLVAEFAETWGFNVLKCDPPRAEAERLSASDGFVEFETILKNCDIITFHTPLKRDAKYPTFHMLNVNNVGQLSKDTVVLNSSRGEVIETQALLAHIGRGGRCCVDTWESEPNISIELLNVVDVATPHIAGYSKQGKATATAISVKAVAEYMTLPIKEWFPSDVQKNRAKTHPIWSDVSSSIIKYCDLVGETETLRSNSDRFEELRATYNYREEYF